MGRFSGGVVRWGMIGCGSVTEVKSGPAFSKVRDSRLVAVTSQTASRAKDYAERHGIARWFGDAGELVSSPDVDIVYIATPPDSHEEYTLMAAAAGKPVYVEKPMARRYEEAGRMISACREANVPLFVAYYRRRLPKFLKVKELLSTGAIGDVRAVIITFLQSPRPEVLGAKQLPWRVRPEISGGGYFVDLGSHQLDLMDYYFGPITDVQGWSTNQGGMYPAEDLVTAQFRFENGISGEGIWCFTAAQGAESDRTEIVGTGGTLTFSFFDPSPIRLVTAAGLAEFPAPWPEHVHLPLVQTIVDELLCRGVCPSTGETGARTSLVIDRILGH